MTGYWLEVRDLISEMGRDYPLSTTPKPSLEPTHPPSKLKPAAEA
jgi:hypothetical protein